MVVTKILIVKKLCEPWKNSKPERKWHFALSVSNIDIFIMVGPFCMDILNVSDLLYSWLVVAFANITVRLPGIRQEA